MVGFAIVIGVPLGILISYVKKIKRTYSRSGKRHSGGGAQHGAFGPGYTFAGDRNLPAVVMVIIYSLLPIIKILIGISGIDPAMVEAARA